MSDFRKLLEMEGLTAEEVDAIILSTLKEPKQSRLTANDEPTESYFPESY